MGDKDITDPEDFPRRKEVQIAQVKENSPLFVKEIDVQGRIFEGAVDKAGMKDGFHGACSREIFAFIKYTGKIPSLQGRNMNSIRLVLT
jgi:hypothetical protein